MLSQVTSHRCRLKKPPSSAILRLFGVQYLEAKKNDNDIQRNRIADARDDSYLCQVNATIQGWTGKVYRVDTRLIDSRNRASVYLQISDNVWFRGATINSNENSELFETIAKLKKGDKIRVSGTLQQQEQNKCVSEVSITQTGGMETPEFRLNYSKIESN